jgi:hypothetical protein
MRSFSDTVPATSKSEIPIILESILRDDLGFLQHGHVSSLQRDILDYIMILPLEEQLKIIKLVEFEKSGMYKFLKHDSHADMSVPRRVIAEKLNVLVASIRNSAEELKRQQIEEDTVFTLYNKIFEITHMEMEPEVVSDKEYADIIAYADEHPDSIEAIILNLSQQIHRYTVSGKSRSYLPQLNPASFEELKVNKSLEVALFIAYRPFYNYLLNDYKNGNRYGMDNAFNNFFIQAINVRHLNPGSSDVDGLSDDLMLSRRKAAMQVVKGNSGKPANVDSTEIEYASPFLSPAELKQTVIGMESQVLLKELLKVNTNFIPTFVMLVHRFNEATLYFVLSRLTSEDLATFAVLNVNLNWQAYHLNWHARAKDNIDNFIGKDWLKIVNLIIDKVDSLYVHEIIFSKFEERCIENFPEKDILKVIAKLGNNSIKVHVSKLHTFVVRNCKEAFKAFLERCEPESLNIYLEQKIVVDHREFRVSGFQAISAGLNDQEFSLLLDKTNFTVLLHVINDCHSGWREMLRPEDVSDMWEKQLYYVRRKDAGKFMKMTLLKIAELMYPSILEGTWKDVRCDVRLDKPVLEYIGTFTPYKEREALLWALDKTHNLNKFLNHECTLYVDYSPIRKRIQEIDAMLVSDVACETLPEQIPEAVYASISTGISNAVTTPAFETTTLFAYGSYSPRDALSLFRSTVRVLPNTQVIIDTSHSITNGLHPGITNQNL